MLLCFIETQFPIQVFEEQAVRISLAPGPSTQGLASQAANPDQSALKKAAVARAMPTGPVDQNCLTMRNQLLESAQALALPPNVLDELIGELGGPSAVAEMTGWKGRIVRTVSDACIVEKYNFEACFPPLLTIVWLLHRHFVSAFASSICVQHPTAPCLFCVFDAEFV
jgi:hypothetical protein